jgi:uncharacterized protein
MTRGHLDLVARASALFDELVVAVGANSTKMPLLMVDERLALITEACEGYDNVTVTSFSGLLVDFCRARSISTIVKGVRAAADFDSELQMARMNTALAAHVDTIFLAAAPEYSYVASSLVREIAAMGGDVSALVPESVATRWLEAAVRLPPKISSASFPEVISLAGLDPRAPFVLDTHELSRRPGSQRQVSRTVPAPADLGIDILRAVEGAPIELDLRLEAVMEGVLVTGSAAVELELFVYTDQGRRDSSLPVDDVRELEGDLLDLEPLVRDAVVLELPFQPLCADKCPGLCADCGVRLAENPTHSHGEVVDPRWAALAVLTHDEND